MKKLHVKIDGTWEPVFCNRQGRIITCSNEPKKALPQLAMWGNDDLKYFSAKFANNEFCLMTPQQ